MPKAKQLNMILPNLIKNTFLYKINITTLGVKIYFEVLNKTVLYKHSNHKSHKLFDQKTAQKYFVYSCQTVFEPSKVLCTVRPIPLKFVLHYVAFIPYLQVFRLSVQFTNHILTILTSNTYLGLIQTHDNSSDRCLKSTPILLKQVNKNKFVQINGLKYFSDTCVKNRDIDSLMAGNRGI